MLEWYIYVEDWNTNEINSYNIFEHSNFWKDCIKNAKKNKNNKEHFIEDLKNDLMYYFWSKSEYEIVLSPWLGANRVKEKKIDVYDQIKLNWDRFVDYVWEHKREIK